MKGLKVYQIVCIAYRGLKGREEGILGLWCTIGVNTME